MLDGMELRQPVHGVILLHVDRLRLHAKTVQVGDCIRQRRIALHPSRLARDLQDLDAQRLNDGRGEQPAYEQVAVPVHAAAELDAVIHYVGRIKKGLH